METTSETTTTENTTRTRPSGNPPARPGDSTSTDGTTGTQEMTGEPPEMLGGEMPEDMEGMEPPEGMEGMTPPDGNFPGQTTATTENTWHPVAYLSLGAGSLLISTIIIYLCFSNFCHKKPAQTFDTKQKFIWFVLTTLILTVGLITLCYFIPIWTS